MRFISSGTVGRGRANRATRLALAGIISISVITACGGDDDDQSASTAASNVTADTAVTDTADAGTTAPTTSDGTAAPATEVATGEPIKVGAMVSLSGAYSNLGADTELGLKALASTNPSACGRPIEFEIENDQSDPTTGASVARRLVDDDEIVAILGPNTGAVLIPAVPILVESTKPVMIYTPVPYPNYNQEPFLFGPNVGPLDVQVKGMLDYAEAEGVTKLVAISGDDAIGAAVKPVWEASGTPVELVPASITDYTPLVTRLRSEGYDGVALHLANGEQAGNLVRSMADIGWEVPRYASLALLNQSFTATAGDAIVGLRGFMQVASIDPTQLKGEAADMARFVQDAVEAVAPGEIVSQRSNLAYTFDQAYSIVLALQATCEAGIDGTRLAEFLETQEFQGASGYVKRSKGDHVGFQPETQFRAYANEDKEFVLADVQPAGAEQFLADS